ncbi:MAG: FeoC-like transcriptional regulator [Anaerolineae bacterium]
MLEKLTSILKRGGTVTVDQMARELDTSPQLVSQMLDHMTSAGWLRQLEASCASTCDECVFVRDCQRSTQGRVWQVGRQE